VHQSEDDTFKRPVLQEGELPPIDENGLARPPSECNKHRRQNKTSWMQKITGGPPPSPVVRIVRKEKYNIFDGEVFNDAYAHLKLHDLRLKAIVHRLQRNFRARHSRGERERRDLSTTAAGINMKSHIVNSPSYFGESCLWIPSSEWATIFPKHMYNARCEKRGELVCVPRAAIGTVLGRFSPWLPERFEYFREAVVDGLRKTVKRSADEETDDTPVRRHSKGFFEEADFKAPDVPDAITNGEVMSSESLKVTDSLTEPWACSTSVGDTVAPDIYSMRGGYLQAERDFPGKKPPVSFPGQTIDELSSPIPGQTIEDIAC